jgi:hypothetical protein
MAGSFDTSWSLVRASARVLKQDRELLVFPLISGIATVLVMASFVAPLVATGAWRMLELEQGSYLAYVLGFLFYFVQYTVVFFFNSALVGAALIRMEGGDPTVGDGLRIAISRLPAILGYAAVASTVGMVLRAISERSGWLGRLVAGLVGMGWTLATFLAVPVLVSRNVGPIDAVRESATLFKRTWGEQIIGSFGMGWVFFILWAVWGLLMGIPFLLLWPVSQWGAVGVIGIMILGFVALGLVQSSLHGIYTAALYRYATRGDAGPFGEDLLQHAFKRKGYGSF